MKLAVGDPGGETVAEPEAPAVTVDELEELAVADAVLVPEADIRDEGVVWLVHEGEGAALRVALAVGVALPESALDPLAAPVALALTEGVPPEEPEAEVVAEEVGVEVEEPEEVVDGNEEPEDDSAPEPELLPVAAAVKLADGDPGGETLSEPEASAVTVDELE